MRKSLLICFALLGFIFNEALAQSKTVTGTVKDATGETLPGVSVVLKSNPSKGTQTDIEGKFRIQVPSDDAVLVFSFAGMETQEVAVAGKTALNVTLKDKELEAVIKIGYQSQLEKEFTGVAASVDAEAVEKLPVLSVDQALQGQAAGVQVVASSGTPGGGISVLVRGQTSVSAGNAPLYVVDGVPVVNANLSAQGMGGQGTNTLAGLNPDDIESISVLKDASATAIYGARAANGVVLITTKRGKAGKTQFQFNMFRGWAEEVNRIDMLNSEQYAMIRREAFSNDGLPEPDIPTDVDTDWFDEVFRMANISQYQLSVRGGDAKTTYYISGSYRDEQGVIIGSNFERLTGRLNLDHKATDKLRFGTSLSLSSDVNDRIKNDNNIFGVLSTAILIPPNIPVRDEEGEYSTWAFANPVASAFEPRYENTTMKFIGNINASYDIIPGLTVKADLSTDFNYYKEDHFEPATTIQGQPAGRGFYSTREAMIWAFEPQVTYSRTFAEDHKLNLLGGMTFQEEYLQGNWVIGEGFSGFGNQTYIGTAAQITDGTSFYTDYGFNSIFGRAAYSYQGKYNVSATVRRDGSSRFGPDTRFGVFWAVSGGWVISDEAFFEGASEIVNLLKLRGGYGVTGNDQIGNFAWIGQWGTGSYLGSSATLPSTIANPELQWEETGTFDIGVEASFLNSRINLNAGYFSARTTDLLFGNPIPNTTGFNTVTDNIGIMTNKGWEIELQGTPVNAGGFRWDINFNTAIIDNELVELIDDEPILAGFGSAIIEGQPMNTFYGYNYEGVDPETGNAIYTDIDGDGVITAEDQTVIGNAQADFYGGLTNTFSYKGIELSIFFQYSQGNEIYNNNWGFIQTVGRDLWNQDASVLRRWQQPGDQTDIPRATAQSGDAVTNNLGPSSREVLDGSFVRLKNLALSYNLPSNVISKVGLESVRIGLSGQNLMTFTNYEGFDPEVSTFGQVNASQGTDFFTFPQAKIYMINLDIGF